MARRRKIRSYRSYPRRFVRRGRRVHKKLPLLPMMGAVGGAMSSLSGGDSMVKALQRAIKGEDIGLTVGNTWCREILGYDQLAKKWTMPTFTTMLIGGAVASKVLTKVGINRMVNLPYVKL